MRLIRMAVENVPSGFSTAFKRLEVVLENYVGKVLEGLDVEGKGIWHRPVAVASNTGFPASC